MGGRFIAPSGGQLPPLGRYCVFGNLFARMGIASAGAIYRLDRHPSMESSTPSRPLMRGDLRVHLVQADAQAHPDCSTSCRCRFRMARPRRLEKLLADSSAPPASPRSCSLML